MAVSVRNVHKFITDHPKTFANPQPILEAAQRIGKGPRGRITGPNAELLLGPYSKCFFEEIEKSQEHLRILEQDLFSQ